MKTRGTVELMILNKDQNQHRKHMKHLKCVSVSVHQQELLQAFRSKDVGTQIYALLSVLSFLCKSVTMMGLVVLYTLGIPRDKFHENLIHSSQGSTTCYLSP